MCEFRKFISNWWKCQKFFVFWLLTFAKFKITKVLESESGECRCFCKVLYKLNPDLHILIVLAYYEKLCTPNLKFAWLLKVCVNEIQKLWNKVDSQKFLFAKHLSKFYLYAFSKDNSEISFCQLDWSFLTRKRCAL